jgi:CelD/BcsL family acetyltransferase involved in cellulose biosynthesis
MNYQIIGPNHPLWMETLQQLPYDFYHLPAFVKLEADRVQAIPEAILIQAGKQVFFLPYLRRQWQEPRGRATGWDVISPYGYPGFLVNATSDRAAFIRSAIAKLQAVWQDHQICSAFLRLHPILNAAIAQDLVDDPAIQASGGTVAIDLSPSLEALWKQTRENHRRGIRRLKQAGFSVERVPMVANLDSFITIYEQTMDRVGAKPMYYFTRDYFLELIHRLSDHLHLFVVRVDQTIASAALISECNGIVQYHLGATLDQFLKEAPIKLLFDDVRTWAKERGNHVFHLGGGLGGGQDSLYNFKLGFANQTHTFSTVRFVINQTQYHQWTGFTAEQCNQTPEQLLNSNFFPAYRALS